MTELLPPNPDASGWHYVTGYAVDPPDEQAWHWDAETRQWDVPEMSPGEAGKGGWRHTAVIPPAAQLRAMGEIVAAANTRLAEIEKTEGAVPNDALVGFGGHAFVTAGMIRRAAGEKA